jgi:arginyl-tRNA synthetase
MSASVARRIDARLAQAFAALKLPIELARAVPADRPDLADRQCNGAFGAAKQLRRNPREIAAAVVERLKDSPEFAEVSVAGPGFINLRLSDAFLVQAATEQAADPNLTIDLVEQPQAIVIDFGGPNVAKPLHVGHLRSLVIGESLRRILLSLGHRVISDIHLGDWGLQMGMLIAETKRTDPSLAYFDPASSGPYPRVPPFSLAELETMYQRAAAACEADPARLEAARRATAELQSGRPGYVALWRHFREVSLSAQQTTFDELGAHFDLFLGESDVAPRISALIEELTAKGVVVHSEGALVIPVAEPTDTKEIPPLILAKSDGAALYSTTDLATIADRIERLRPARMLYVVDQRQALHFEQVFRAARKSGLAEGCELEHVGFGTVNGKDGKPLKTRAGGAAKLDDLIDEAVEKARERVTSSQLEPDLGNADRDRLARLVAIAAVKFADLSSTRTAGYVFDPDRVVSFEGKTGPYLQYACVRISAIVAKAHERGHEPGALVLTHDTERELIIEALRFPEALAAAARTLMPSEIAEYAFGLAQRFSRFYVACRVLDAEDEAVRASRLALCALTYRVLAKALWMLAIGLPERM